MARKTVKIEVGNPDVALPFETEELRRGLEKFLDQVVPGLGRKKVGDFRWGIYAFFDFDGEPIYVGQTNEKIRTRIRRHLTNQRTDAVAMSVLDPFEVCEVQVWPISEYESINPNGKTSKVAEAKANLNALEYRVFQDLLKRSAFRAVLNEKAPSPVPGIERRIPTTTLRERVVSEAVSTLRDHPDLRIARRAATLARLAKIISERKVQKGLRVVLHTQARRLESLARRRIGAARDLAEVDDRTAEEQSEDEKQ